MRTLAGCVVPNPLKEAMELGMRAQMEVWRASDPEGFMKAANELSRMPRDEVVKKLRAVASERGVDIDALASRYGVRL